MTDLHITTCDIAQICSGIIMGSFIHRDSRSYKLTSGSYKLTSGSYKLTSGIYVYKWTNNEELYAQRF